MTDWCWRPRVCLRDLLHFAALSATAGIYPAALGTLRRCTAATEECSSFWPQVQTAKPGAAADAARPVHRSRPPARPCGLRAAMTPSPGRRFRLSAVGPQVTGKDCAQARHHHGGGPSSHAALAPGIARDIPRPSMSRRRQVQTGVATRRASRRVSPGDGAWLALRATSGQGRRSPT